MGRGSSKAGSGGGGNPVLKNKIIENLPELTGSEKQVKWAAQIRSDAQREMFNYATTQSSGRPSSLYAVAQRGEKAKRQFIEDAVSNFNEKIKTQRRAEYEEKFSDLDRRIEVYNRIFSHSDAKYWIDRRSNSEINYQFKRFKAMIDGDSEVTIFGKTFVVPENMRRKK